MPRLKWMNNIEMHFEEIEWSVVNLICLAQDRDKSRALVKAAMNIRIL
jgi:hypothetical protein